jgi:hypothetical protein
MRKKYYLTLDTETATLPFANEIAKNDAKKKQQIAIAKPLVYDIGWVITDRQGNIIKKENFLVQETFFVPNVFNTAYYCDKRPMYMEMLEKNEVQVANWNDIIELLMFDLDKVDIVTAYNACFDFKKAIPFTEQYIFNLYSTHFNDWERSQRKKCEYIIKGQKNNQTNPDYLEPWFELRGKTFPLCDLWGVACERLININKYRNYCLDKGLLTASKIYFKSSAETSFQYLMNDYDFIEHHTALSDAEIESVILTKALKKGKIDPYLKEFPFKELGYTYDYVMQKKPKYLNFLLEELSTYYESINYKTSYATRIKKIIQNLEDFE